MFVSGEERAGGRPGHAMSPVSYRRGREKGVRGGGGGHVCEGGVGEGGWGRRGDNGGCALVYETELLLGEVFLRGLRHQAGPDLHVELSEQDALERHRALRPVVTTRRSGALASKLEVAARAGKGPVVLEGNSQMLWSQRRPIVGAVGPIVGAVGLCLPAVHPMRSMLGRWRALASRTQPPSSTLASKTYQRLSETEHALRADSARIRSPFMTGLTCQLNWAIERSSQVPSHGPCQEPLI